MQSQVSVSVCFPYMQVLTGAQIRSGWLDNDNNGAQRARGGCADGVSHPACERAHVTASRAGSPAR